VHAFLRATRRQTYKQESRQRKTMPVGHQKRIDNQRKRNAGRGARFSGDKEKGKDISEGMRRVVALSLDRGEKKKKPALGR